MVFGTLLADEYTHKVNVNWFKNGKKLKRNMRSACFSNNKNKYINGFNVVRTSDILKRDRY